MYKPIFKDEPDHRTSAQQLVLRLSDGSYLLSFHVPQTVEHESTECAWRARPLEEFHLPADTLLAIFPGSRIVKLTLSVAFFAEVPQ